MRGEARRAVRPDRARIAPPSLDRLRSRRPRSLASRRRATATSEKSRNPRVSRFQPALSVERRSRKRPRRRIVGGGRHHHGNGRPSHCRGGRGRERGKTQPRRAAARFHEVHMRVGMETAYDVNGRRERLGDIAVHIERRGENAGGRNQLAHPPDDLALGVVEIGHLQCAVKREEDRVQRQVRLDRRATDVSKTLPEPPVRPALRSAGRRRGRTRSPAAAATLRGPRSFR